MKRYPYSLLIEILILFSTSLSAQWTRTGGPSGGEVLSIQSNDQYLFAGAENGIYRSADEGHHWERLMDGLPFSIDCYDIDVADKNLIFFGWDHIKNWAPPYDYQVYKSADNGDHWFQVTLPDTVHFPSQVAIHDSMIFVSSHSLLKSTDNGETWTTLLSQQDSFYNSGQQLEIYNNKLFVVGGNKVWITDDWGATWKKIKFPSGCHGYNVFPKDSLLILICENEAYRSINDGASWQKATGFQGANTNWKDIQFLNDTFYVNSYNVLRSIDFGISWESVLPESNYFYPYGVTSFKGGIYACSLSNGVHQFWPPADTLQIRDYGIDATYIGALSIHDDVLWAGVDDNGLFKYDIISQTWDSLNYFPVTIGMPDITWMEDSLFVIDLYGGVYRSGNGGHSWTKIYESENGYINELLTVGSSLYVIDDNNEVLDKSDDFGKTWQPAFPNFHSETNSYKGYFVPHHGYYFMSTNDRLFRSPDAGTSWQEINTGITFTFGFIKKLRSEGPYLFMETYDFDGVLNYHLTLYVSLDDGLSWSPFMEGLPDILSGDPTVDYQLGLVYYSDTLVLATYADGVYYRTSQDLSWQPLMLEDKFPKYTGVLALSKDKLFVGTSGMGVWQKGVDNTTHTKELVSSFHQLSIVPNPASQKITIKTEENVIDGMLFIVDMKGNIVVDKNINTVKSFSIPIDQFPAGQYSVRLETTDKIYIGSFFKK
jgi:photosystem II stability/assembly factor-like uncharacterized protein